MNDRNLQQYFEIHALKKNLQWLADRESTKLKSVGVNGGFLVFITFSTLLEPRDLYIEQQFTLNKYLNGM